MARDHALAVGLTSDEAILRLYGWSSPTVSLGRNEPAKGRYDLALSAEKGVSFVRRPTGGRAVLHHREVTYAVVSGVKAFGGLREAYVAIHRALARGLQRLGVPISISGEEALGGSLPPSAGPCFREAAPGELVAGGRKLVGSAQARLGRSLLQHGSILIEDDQALLELLALGSGGPSASEPSTLAGLLESPPTVSRVIAQVASGFREEMRGEWLSTRSVAKPLPADLLEHYRSDEWTWRR